ncbi:MAG: hypothetical protein U0M96_04715 [Eggerthellaceae bacterium]
MNEEVLKMIDTLHARLDDVREAVESLPKEAPQYAEKLDKVDDKIYLIQCEIESYVQSLAQESGEGEEEVPATDAGAGAANANAGDGVASAEGTSSAEEVEEISKAASGDALQGASGEEGEKKEIFSDDMKENLADAGRAIGNIYRDGKEVVAELSGTMGDLKDIFSFGKKR